MDWIEGFLSNLGIEVEELSRENKLLLYFQIVLGKRKHVTAPCSVLFAE